MVKKGAFHFEKSYSIMYGHLKKCHSVTSLEVHVQGGTEAERICAHWSDLAY